MKTKPLHNKEKRKLSSWRLMRLHRLHAFYRRLMYRRSGIAMLAVLLTLIMTGPYACIKIDMIETKEKAEQNEKQKGLISPAQGTIPVGEDALLKDKAATR
jgi:hypothetical protein